VGPTNRTPVRGAARLAAILDALPDALLLVDSSGAIVNANAAALNLFEGESAERLLGRQIVLVLPGIGRSLAAPGADPTALPPGPSAATAPPVTGPVRRAPERMAARRTDGGVFPAEVTTAELGEDDDAGLTLLVVRDLSGVLDVEAELRRQQRQIELILRAASEGIIGVDHEGRIVLVNPAGAKILRYRAAELGGQDAHELLTHSRADGTPLPEEECALLDTVRTGAKHRALDSVLWRSDGGPVYVDLTTAPVYEGENIIGAVMTFVDNTASRAAARQAAELAEVLDQELRGGLADLGARVHNLLERSVLEYTNSGYQASAFDGAAFAALEELEVDLGRLSVLSADLVDFQQSVLGTPAFETETVELVDLVEEAVDAARPAAGAVGVEIAAHCAEVEVELDPALFVKLLVHLLSDMVAVSPVGGKIVVTAARRGALARIEIRGPHTGGGPLHLPIAQAIAARHGGPVEATAKAEPGDEKQKFSMHAFGAVFVEVTVDEDLGEIRVPRVVGVYGVGKLMNEKTGYSQLMGGIVWGIGLALFEETLIDKREGRAVNANLAEYHVPTNADIQAIDVQIVDEDDPHVNPLGAKGIGEVGITGVGAAIANAVFHATGKRVRDLPITLDKLL